LLAKLYKKQLAKVKVAGTLSEWFCVIKKEVSTSELNNNLVTYYQYYIIYYETNCIISAAYNE